MIMSKERKGNRESKKSKKQSDKQKKDPNRHDGPVTRVVNSSNEQRNT
jgi:hypothetical protein